MAKVFIEESTLSAIGDAIREKEGSTELVPVTDMATRISAISGGDSFYDTFWDSFQSNGYTFGTRASYNYAFSSAGWSSENYKPKYPFPKLTHASGMFEASRITDTLYPIDFTNTASSTLTATFNGCKNLVTIRPLTVQPRHIYSSTFGTLPALENITFEGEIGNDINFGSCTNLSRASIENIVSHLKFGVVSTVTFSETALANAGWGINGRFDHYDWEAYFFVVAKGWEYALAI